MKKNDILYPANENGIYLYEYPIINGIKQYVQVRGENRKNPLLLFIHGGPGGSLAGVCHVIQAEWEKHFTVVNWDQRSTCKTYFANIDSAAEIAKTGTVDDFVKDIDDIIAYLHTVYDFDKLILMGYSWGTAIGAEYAKRRPENLMCYIAAGQLVNYRDGLLTVCRKMQQLAPENSADAKKIDHIIDSFPQKPVWNRELMQLIGSYPALTLKYIAKHAKQVPIGKILTSPFMNLKEKKASLIPNYAALEKSYETMLSYDFRSNMTFDIPVLFIYGEEENICPPELLKERFDDISAPLKKMEIIPQASHGSFLDQPERFMEAFGKFVGELS